MDLEEKRRSTDKLFQAAAAIEDVDRRASALRKMAELISECPLQTLSKVNALELLEKCMTEAGKLPPEHPAASFTIREIGLHLAQEGASFAYPREALMSLDVKF